MTPVTVVIPIYNRALMLAQALESLRAQTMRDFFVVVSDNASEDDLASVVARFDDLSIRYHRIEKQVSALENFSRGVDLCRTEFLKFLCSDDLLLPSALADLVGAMQRAPKAGICLGGCVTFSVGHDGIPHLGKERRTPPLSARRQSGAWMVPDGFFVEGGLGYSLTPSACLYRTAAVQEIGGINTGITTVFDWELFVALSAQYEVALVEQPVCAFREHPGQWTQDSHKQAAFHRDAFWITSKANPLRSRLGIPRLQQEHWRLRSASHFLANHPRTFLTLGGPRGWVREALPIFPRRYLWLGVPWAIFIWVTGRFAAIRGKRPSPLVPASSTAADGMTQGQFEAVANPLRKWPSV